MGLAAVEGLGGDISWGGARTGLYSGDVGRVGKQAERWSWIIGAGLFSRLSNQTKIYILVERVEVEVTRISPALVRRSNGD